MLSKIINFILKHKAAAIIIIILAVVVGYFANKTLSGQQAETRYVLSKVEKGTIIASVSGSGQVSALNQVEIKPKVSGEVVYVGVKSGQEVKAGASLVQIDTSDAQKASRDAETSLETAKLELEELLSPPDELTILQAKNSLTKAKDAKQNAEDDIVSGYEDAFNAVTDTFFDLPTIVTRLHDFLYSYEIGKSEITISDYAWNISALENSLVDEGEDKNKLEKLIETATNNYETTKEKYDKNLEDYKNTSRYSEQNIIEALLAETMETLRAAAESIKSEINLFDFWVDYCSLRNLRVFSKVTEYQTNLKSYTSTTNSYLTNLLKIQRSFQDNKQAVSDDEYSIKEKELALEELMAGPDDLDIRAKKIAIQQKEDALRTAQENLANCYVRAPFNGVVAEIDVKKGDSVSSGTKLLILASKQKIAEVTLNEIDIAKVRVGQKTNITFDALPELSITGKVLEIDTVGTVSQGVVSYGIKIGFDTEEEQIKPGMSVTVEIITEAKQDVLLIPISAVKTTGNNSFAEVLVDGQPQEKTITTGLSNDAMIEVIEGLTEGEQIITQTTTNGSSTGQSTNNRQGGGSQTNPMRGIFQMMR